MDNFINIILNSSSLFEYYITHKNIIKSSKKGYLYIFNCDAHNHNELVKFGETDTSIKERLYGYPREKINMRNIYALTCSLSQEREALIKGFLKHETEYDSLVGTEYYSKECFNLIKLLILIISNFSEEEIEINYNYYSKKNKDCKIFFNKIKNILFNIKNNHNYDLEIEYIKKNEDINNFIIYNCEFCKKVYKSLSSLNYHKKTAKFCLDLQKENNNNNIKIKEYKCEHCDKKFTQKSSLISHLCVCNVKNYKDKIDNKIKELKNNYENIITELKFENKLKDEQNKLKDENILRLEQKLDNMILKLKKLDEKITFN